MFDRVDLALDRAYYPGGRLTVTAPGTSGSQRYIQGVRVDGKAYQRTYITTDTLRRPSTLEFTVGARPSGWGTAPKAAPPALK